MNATAAACCPSFGHASGPEPANRLKNNSPPEGYVVTSLEDRKRAASTGCRETGDGVDGADVIPRFVVKGGGGALLREKIVAAASARTIAITDDTKWVPAPGRFRLPIKGGAVRPYGDPPRCRGRSRGRRMSGAGVLRRTQEGHPFVTDSGHRLLDASLGRIPDPKAVTARLPAVPGVVEHGLFVAAAIVAGSEGVQIIQANRICQSNIVTSRQDRHRQSRD
jgi:ribose 5-phosphate isomerase